MNIIAVAAFSAAASMPRVEAKKEGVIAENSQLRLARNQDPELIELIELIERILRCVEGRADHAEELLPFSPRGPPSSG